MAAERTLTGRLAVALPPGEAFALFTPCGEREWVPGWEPRFPAPGGAGCGDAYGPAGDDSAPGTVFQTGDTTWVVLDRTPGRLISYARINPTVDAGTVTVTLDEAGTAASDVSVTYRLTALTDPGREHLTRFAAGYPAFLRAWAAAIGAALAARGAATRG
jgi:hypothetical protein